ncbi:hypothetical protein THF5G08_10447 [Vibrio jasicida]|nr:hypothetical protein THF5G08_10447 [Vibrio jasicida]
MQAHRPVRLSRKLPMFTALLCSIWALKSCKREGGLTEELKLNHIGIKTQSSGCVFLFKVEQKNMRCQRSSHK